MFHVKHFDERFSLKERKESDLILKYLELILDVNKTINLTRIEDFRQALILHVEDSLSALTEIDDAPEGLYGDLGTGGGFPGVPIAIESKRRTILVDSVKKKAHAVENVLEELGLSESISVYGGRIEELAIDHPGEFSVLTARALSQLPSLLELAAPLLRMNGRLVCYKARISDDEITRATVIEKLTGMKMVSRRTLVLSDGETCREIITFEKVSRPRLKLPRRIGMAQNNPLA